MHRLLSVSVSSGVVLLCTFLAAGCSGGGPGTLPGSAAPSPGGLESAGDPNEVAPTASGSPTSSVSSAVASNKPPEISQILASEDAEQLAAWAKQTHLKASLRYTALRRLEQVDPRQAVRVAQGLLPEHDRLLHTNALALLARSDDPEAKAALSALDPKDRRLAASLSQR